MTEVYASPDGGKFRFGDLVVAEMVAGVPDERRVGRLVQVRKGVGAFKTDMYLILLKDGTLQTFENVMIRSADDRRFVEAFYLSNGRKPPNIGDHSTYPEHEPNYEYTVAGKYPETGFIITEPKQPDSKTQSFSMVIIKEPK